MSDPMNSDIIQHSRTTLKFKQLEQDEYSEI